MQNKKKSPFNFNPFKKKEEIVKNPVHKKISDITDLLDGNFKSNSSSKPLIEKPQLVNTPIIKEEILLQSKPEKSSREIEDENEVIERKLQTKQVEIDKFEKTAHEENQKLSALNQKLSEHKKTYHTYLEEVHRFSDLIQQIEDKNNKSEEEIENLIKETHTKKLELQQAHNQLRNIECEYKMNYSLTQNLEAKIAKFQPDIIQLNDFFSKQKQNSLKLEQKNEELNTTIRAYQKQKIQLTEESAQLEQTISQINIQNNELDSRNNKLENAVTQLNHDHAKKVIEKNEAQKEQEHLEKQHDELEEILRAKNVEISRIANEEEHLRSDITQKKNKISFLQEDISEYEAQLNISSKEFKTVDQSQQELTKELELINNDLINKQKDLHIAQERKREIDKDIIVIQSKIKHQTVQKNSTIQNLDFINTDIEQRSESFSQLKISFELHSKEYASLCEHHEKQYDRLNFLINEEKQFTITEKELLKNLQDVRDKDKNIVFNIESKEKSLNRLKNKNLTLKNDHSIMAIKFSEKQKQNHAILNEIKEIKTDRSLLTLAVQETKEQYNRSLNQADTIYARLQYLKKKQAQLVAQTNRKQNEVEILEASIKALTEREIELDNRATAQSKRSVNLEKQSIVLKDSFKKLKLITTKKSESLAILIRKNKHFEDRNLNLKNHITDNNVKISSLNQKYEFFENKLSLWTTNLSKLRKEEEVQNELMAKKTNERNMIISKLEKLNQEIVATKLSNKVLNDELYSLSETNTNKHKLVIENENLLSKLRLQSRSLQENIKSRKMKLDSLTRKSTEYKDEINMQYDLIKLLRNKIIDLEDKLEIGHEEVQNCQSKFEEGNILLANIEQYEQKLYFRDNKESQA